MHGVPRVAARTLSRPRLLRHLDTLTRLVLVEGAPGSGRTTLLADWLRNHNGAGSSAAVWVDASGVDGRLALWSTVLEHLFDAGVLGGDSTDYGAPLVTEGSLDDTMKRTFRDFAWPVTLILDHAADTHHPAFADDLIRILEAAPHHRMVVTLDSTAGVLPALTAAGLNPGVIPGERLLFTREETGSILAHHAVSPQVIDAVQHATGGLAIAVRMVDLLLQESEGRMAPLLLEEELPARLGPLLHDRIRAALASEEAFEHVRMLAVLGDALGGLTPELVRATRSSAAVERMLEVGIARQGTADEAARAQPAAQLIPVINSIMLRDFQHRTSSSHDLAAAADAAFRSGAVATAVRLLVDAGDLDAADRMAAETLRRWPMPAMDEFLESLTAIPRGRLRRYPFLAAQLAMVLHERADESTRAREYLEMVALGRRHHRALRDDERILLASLIPLALRLLGRSAEAVRSAGHTMELLERDGRHITPAARAAAAAQCGMVALVADRVDTARTWWLDAATVPSPAAPHPMLAALAVQDGDLSAAQAHLGRVNDRPTGGAHGAFTTVAAALLALERFDLEQARAAVEQLPVRPADPTWPWAEQILSLLDLLAFDPVTAATRVAARRMVVPVPAEPLAARLMTHTDILLSLAQGQREEPLLLIDQLSEPDPVQRARVLLVTGRSAPLVAADVSEGSLRRRLEALLLDAANQQLRGLPGAATSFGEALEILDSTGMRLPLAMLPRQPIAQLLRAADDAGDVRAARIDLDAVPELFTAEGSAVTLSGRESVVLGALARHHSTVAIAAELAVSPNTIKAQLRSIYRKLGVTTREGALIAAAERQLLGGS